MGQHGISSAHLSQTDDQTKPQKQPPRREKSFYHLPMTRTTKLSGTIERRGCGLSAVAAGGGPNFAVTTNTLCVLESSAIVRAPCCVGTLSAKMNLSGDSSCTTVKTPSPQDAKASAVSSSKAVASTPSPIGNVATTLPSSAFTIAIILLSQPENNRRFLRSRANPLGSVQGASGHFAFTSILFASMASISLLSSMLTKISPLPSLAANSGLPSSLMVPSTVPFSASSTVESLLLPLKVKTRLVAGSNRIASGFCPTFTLLLVASVLRSKMLTVFSRPLLVKPRPRSVARAMPCTPGVSAISPTTLPESASTTMT